MLNISFDELESEEPTPDLGFGQDSMNAKMTKMRSMFKDTSSIIDSLNENQKSAWSSLTGDDESSSKQESDKLAVSIFMADKLNQTPKWAYDNYDQLTEGWFGDKGNTAGAINKIKDSIDIDDDKAFKPEDNGMGRVESSLNQGVQSFLNTLIPGTIEGLTSFAAFQAYAMPSTNASQEALKKMYGIPEPSTPELRKELTLLAFEEAKNSSIYKQSRDLRRYFEREFEANPKYREEFWASQLPQGVGSTAAFFTGGATAKGLGASSKIQMMSVTAAMGAASNGSSALIEAEKAGASIEEQWNVFVLNSFVGTSEAIPISRFLEKLDTLPGAGLKKKVKEAGIEGIEEFIQEFVQTTAGNAIAKEFYDENRKLFDNSLEQGQVGGMSGFMISLMLGIGKRAPKNFDYTKDIENSANRELRGKNGGIMTEEDLSDLSRSMTPDQFSLLETNIPNGKILKEAIEGRPGALSEYNETLTINAPQSEISPGIVEDNITYIGEGELEGTYLEQSQDGEYVLNALDGKRYELDQSDPEDSQLIYAYNGGKEIEAPIGGIQKEVDNYVAKHGSYGISINIERSAQEGSKIKGQFDPSSGEVTLYANNISRNEVNALLRHEHYVHGLMESIVGKDRFRNVINQAAGSAREVLGDDLYSRYIDQYSDVPFDQRRGMIGEEVIAYMAQNYDNLTSDNRNIIRRVIDSFKLWAKDFLNIEYTDQDVLNVLSDGYKKLRNSRGKSKRYAPTKAYTSRPMMATEADTQEITESTPAELYKKAIEKTRFKSKVEIPEETKWQKWVRKVQNKMNRLEQVVGRVKEDRALEDSEDVSLSAELYIGKAAQKVQEFSEKIYGYQTNSIFKRLNTDGFTQDQLGEYLHAQHAQERNAYNYENSLNKEVENAKRRLREKTNRRKFSDSEISKEIDLRMMIESGSGMSNTQAQSILEKYAGSGIEAYAQEFRKEVIEFRLDTLKEGGLLSQEQYENLKSNSYQYYIPLQRTLDADPIFGQSYNSIGGKVRSSVGSDREVKNPAIEAIVQAEAAIMSAEKNKLNQEYLKFFSETDSDLWQVSTPLNTFYEYNAEGELVEIVDESYAAEQAAIVMQARKLNVPQEYIMPVKVEGETRYVMFRDEALVRGLKSIGLDYSVPFLRETNAYFRNVFVNYSPYFPVTNFQRDIQTAFTHITGEKGLTAFAKTMMKMPSAIRGIYRSERNKTDMVTPMQEAYEDYKKSGGKMGFFNMQSFDEMMSRLQRQMKYTSKKNFSPKKMLIWMRDYVEALNSSIELSVRVSSYHTLVEMGESKREAAKFAKNVTVNFNKKGEWGDFLNSIFLFSNASIQGTARIGKSFAENRTTQAIVGGFLAAGFLEEMFLDVMDEDEDYERKYYPGIRATNWVIPTGDGESLTFKVPYGYNVPKTLGNLAYRLMMGKDQVDDATKKAFDSAMMAFNPLGDKFLPQILIPAWEISTNENWYGAPIVPEGNPYVVDGPDFTQYFPSTDKAYVELSKQLYYSGVADVSPEIIEYMTRYLGGGALTAAMDVFTSGENLFSEEPFVREQLRNVPYVKQLYYVPSQKAGMSYIYGMREQSGRREFTPGEMAKFERFLQAERAAGNIDSSRYKKMKKEFYKNQQNIRKLNQSRETD